MKIIEEYSKSKRDAEDYRKSSVTFRQDVDVILRHFKLCQLCFFGVGPRDWKKNKPKFVKGVYDRGITTEYDLGWICIKADQDRVNRQVRPMLGNNICRICKDGSRRKRESSSSIT